jgi:hypothetical protein
MPRIHAFEFEDLSWFPGLVREYMTDFLSFMGGWSPLPYAPFTDRLARALRRTGDERVVDLCSGGGGPAVAIVAELQRELQRPIQLHLTDLYPTASRARAGLEAPSWVSFETRPVDAARVPGELRGFRLVCNGFHHLKPQQARACLADAVQQRRGVAVVELTQRSAVSILQIVLGTSALWVVTPFMKPFRLSRLLLTYLVPVVPLCTLWDGMISCLRVYDPNELRGLLQQLPDHDEYEWDVGRLRVPKLPAALTYLIGIPKA